MLFMIAPMDIADVSITTVQLSYLNDAILLHILKIFVLS